MASGCGITQYEQTITKCDVVCHHVPTLTFLMVTMAPSTFLCALNTCLREINHHERSQNQFCAARVLAQEKVIKNKNKNKNKKRTSA